MTHLITPGNIVSLERTLRSPRGTGGVLVHGTLGTVVSVGERLLTVDFGGRACLCVRPQAVRLVGVPADTEYTDYLEAEATRLEGDIERLQASLCSLLKYETGANCHVRAGS